MADPSYVTWALGVDSPTSITFARAYQFVSNFDTLKLGLGRGRREVLLA